MLGIAFGQELLTVLHEVYKKRSQFAFVYSDQSFCSLIWNFLGNLELLDLMLRDQFLGEIDHLSGFVEMPGQD